MARNDTSEDSYPAEWLSVPQRAAKAEHERLHGIDHHDAHRAEEDK